MTYDIVHKNSLDSISTENALQGFLAGQLTDGTRKIYARDVREVFGDQTPNWDQIAALTPDVVITWRNRLWDNGNGQAATTINRKLTALNCFYDHLIARGLVSLNPAHPKIVKRIKESNESKVRLGISKEELDALLQACNQGKDRQANSRDIALISLMYTCLLRRSEAAGIKWGDLEKDGGRSILKLPHTKSGANDFCPVEPAMIERLNQYYLDMGGAATWMAWFGKSIEECPMFVALDRGHKGNQISDHGVNEIVKRRAKIAGIQPITAHILRHTGITHAIMDGQNLADVQIMARHSDPKITMNYAALIRRLENSPGRSLAANI